MNAAASQTIAPSGVFGCSFYEHNLKKTALPREAAKRSHRAWDTSVTKWGLWRKPDFVHLFVDLKKIRR